MTTETITAKHLEAIHYHTCTENIDNTPSVVRREKAASACTTISLELMEKFLDWVNARFVKDPDEGVWRQFDTTFFYSTKQLVELYLNQK